MADLGKIDVRKVFTPAGLPKAVFDIEFQPYATAIGFLIFAWNSLHEELALLFCAVAGVQDRTIPLAIWYSTESDRGRRKMLKVAAAATFANASPDLLAFGKAVIWLLTECDKLEEGRNNVVHGPLTYSLGAKGPEFTGAFLLGNPRAKKLTGKRLLSEIKWYRHRTDVLSYYAENLHPCLKLKPVEVPGRPRMPPREAYP